jgi:transposase
LRLSKNFPACVAQTMSRLAPATPIEVWFQDEMRVGQKNGLVYQWAKKGTRPRQPKDQRYENAYLFGAVCPNRDTGVALIMPNADTEAMQKHIDQIGRAVAPGAHALIILDKAGWHTTRKLKLPKNLTLVPLPPACPELNAAENIWQYLRQTYLSNCVFQTYTAILDACQVIVEACRDQPRSAAELVPVLFHHRLDPHQSNKLCFQRGSSLAHVNFMLQKGDLVMTDSTNGVFRTMAA